MKINIEQVQNETCKLAIEQLKPHSNYTSDTHAVISQWVTKLLMCHLDKTRNSKLNIDIDKVKELKNELKKKT